MPVLNLIRVWNTAVATVTDYRLDDQVVTVQVPIGSRIFLSPYLGLSQPAIQLVPEVLISFHFIFIHPIDQYIDIGYVKSQKQSLGVKQPGREADHLPKASAKVKKTWIYAFTSPYASIAQCFIS
jgi:hypothetical protein